jgi:hypothetical protein
MNQHHTRIRRTVAVAVAGVSVGLAATIAVAAGTGPDTRPASYHPAERAAIADWARTENLSGLSPASLQPQSRQYGWTPRLAAEMAAIADFAREQGLSGLSPASMQPTDE